MKKIIKRTLVLTMAFFMSAFGIAVQDKSSAKADTGKAKSTIWVIGDSTVSAFNDDYYYPRYGYGTQLQQYFDDSTFQVENLALSGRSSKSYVLDPEYKTLTGGMKNGDYLLIGFGHNDEKLEAGRYTNPNGKYTDEGSFANSLYKNYIVPAEKAGCKVVLCTPIVRRSADGNWAGSNLHVTSTTGEFEGGDYAQSIRNLGKDLNIPVVDMTSLTKNLYDNLGPAETLYLHAWTASDPSSVDNTHTNIWGGKYNGYLASKAIKELNIGTLSDAVLTDKIASAPTKADNLVKNPNYVEIEYNSDLKQSELWNDYGIWKGSVFGNIGGFIDKENFSLGKDANGNMNISVNGNKGKIASTVDGIAMYYYKVPVGSNFTLTAKAKINSITKNDQVSFGLMARDDMYVDESTTAAMGDYVTAAPLKITTSGAWNCFARKNGVLTQGGTISNTSLEPGSTVDLKIQSNSDGYACTFGNEETITGGFDFALTKVDAKNVYVGMFAARNADVTFSDIKLLVDGKEVTAVNEDETQKPSEDENKPGTGENNGGETQKPSEDENKPGTGENNGGETQKPSEDENKPGTGENNGGETQKPSEDENKPGTGENNGGETQKPSEDEGKPGTGEDNDGQTQKPLEGEEKPAAGNDTEETQKPVSGQETNNYNMNKPVKTGDSLKYGCAVLLAVSAAALAISRKKKVRQ